MEPVSITLGVLPLVGAAMKVCKVIHRKLKVFRHYSREVRRIHKQIDRQWHLFTNEVHLLLRPALDDESAIELMLKDAQDLRWSSEELEAGMRKTLGKNYEPCRDVIEEIGSVIESLQSHFSCFDELIVECRRDEPLQAAVRRLRGRIKITWDKSKLEELLQELRGSNDDLRRLREQAYELRKTEIGAESGQRLRKHLSREYGQFGTIRKASRAFHEALASVWSRETDLATTNQLRHTVRLFLDTQVTGDVQMEVAISCHSHGLGHRHLEKERITQLQVRSQVREWIDFGLPTPPDSSQSGCSAEISRKRRRVRFAQDKTDEVDPLDTHRPSSISTNLGLNHDPSSTDYCLKDLCSVLCKSSVGPPWKLDCSAACLGYIDNCSQEAFRHSFYGISVDTDESGSLQSCVTSHGLVSMDEMLSHPAETSLSIVEQLKLARNLVSAVLKFYSTPWLREYFSLCELSFFRRGKDISGCLRTLHVALDFVQWPAAQSQLSMDGVESGIESGSRINDEVQNAVEHAKLQYGIRNVTLWSLGTILLQIGRWSRLDTPDDVPSVRKLSSQVPMLGPKYRDLTKKCLECDFGYGDDLSKPRLQQAVYENLVCELNDMISSLDISDD